MSIVYKSDGTIRCIAKKIKYHSVYMKEDYIEVSIDSPSPIDFSNGDYIIYDYNGIKYTLSDPIGVKKQARKDTYSKAFVYTGIKFNSNFNLLFRCIFLDIVQEDNLNHYTSLPDVDTFEDVYGIAGRIQANLDSQYPNTFNIKIVDTTGNAELESILRTARAFNVSNGYCSDALSTIYDQWGVGYIYTVENGKDTIIIGGTAGESTVFRYGKNNGLRVITSDIQNLSELCNRIFPFGSTRNLPARWYNKKQYIQDLQYAPNLLIPKSKWGDNNPRSAFVENTESINKYGLRPKAIYWDGSDSDRIEVCPSIEGVTAGIIRRAKAEAEDATYVPSTELYPDDELVDEILVGDNIEDDGLNIDTGYKLYSEQYAYAYNAEAGKDFQTNKIGTIGKDGAELGFAFTFEMPNKLTPFTLPKDAVYRIGSPDHELEVIGYNTLPYLYIPRTYAKSYATYLFSQNHPAYLVGRAEGTNDYWRWECSIEESDEGFTIRPIAEQTISLRAGSSLFFSFEVSASILFSDSYAIEHLNEEIFATCYIRGGGFYIQRGLNYIFQDFNIYIKQIGFNIADYPSEDNNYITININTGSCAGRSFKIRKVEYDSALDRWKLNCYRSDDNTLSLRFPNSDFHISAGDKFVITNIQMPDLYVYMAMERLYNEALKELDLLSNPSRIYTPEIDNLQMARSPQVLRAGMFMPISDDDLNIQSDNAILIDSIEVSEGENAIRTFSVTLRNEKQDNILKKNKKGIKSISVALKKSKSEASRVSSNESVNQDSTGVTGGGTSISSYDNLTNKPSINDVELKGNLTSEDLGLQPKGEYVVKDDFNGHINNKDIHISSEEREKWNNKSDLTAEDVKGIKVNNAGHADSADNATKAGSADKLTNSRKIFGLPFDGTKDVDGGITANGDSVINGNLNVKKDGIFGGEVSGIVGEGTPAGVTDYAQLQNKPAINGKELASGENTLDALGIQPKGDYTTATQLTSTLENYATKVYVSNNYASKSAVNAIQALIPATASADNQLADKDFVNSSIATATAEFRGSFTSLDELKATSGNLNDYAFYLHTDSVGNSIVDRYKWTTAGWLYEYTLNNSSFTAEQWAALNSAITATLVNSYNSHLNNTTIHITASERTKWNNKWDYNEETIKAVKVNAAVLSDKATKLATARTLWGKLFDGTSDVSGDLKDVGNITASGKATIQGDIISGGEVAAIIGEGTPVGVTDYSALTGKPSINGVTLVSGNNTLAALGIQAAGDYATNSGVTTLLANYTDKTFVSNNYVGKAAFNNHIADTNIHITKAERAAWNAKWDYNEATIKAVKVTSASSADSVAWAGIADKPTTIAGYGITDALTTSNYNTYAPTLTGTGASGTWGISISGNAATATNADKLDGVHYQNILERQSSGASSSGTATGWFRIAESLTTDSSSITFLLAIRRDYWTTSNESYLFSISISYGGGINITQLSGYANTRLITKIRVDWDTTKIAYVDLYINTSTNQNAYFWYTIGGAKSYTAWTANPTLVGTAYEFTTVNGCKSDRGFTGDLVGNSSSATKLQDDTAFTAWGQTFFENGKPKNVSGDLNLGVSKLYWNWDSVNYYMSSGGTEQMTYNMFGGHIFRAGGAERMRICANGNVLIGTTTDNGYKLDVNGKGHYSDDLVCGGEVAAIIGEGTPVGVTDYSALTGKPSINGVTLVSGNNTLAALGIQAAGDYATNSGVTTLLANYADKTFVSNNYVGKSAFNNHTADTDIHITAAERAAWNAKWDYNEDTIKAVKVNAAVSADRARYLETKYASGDRWYDRYKLYGQWASDDNNVCDWKLDGYYVRVDIARKLNTALTFGTKTYDGSAAATITASDLGALTAHQSIYALTLQVNSVSQGTYNPTSAAKTINIAVPTKTSDITNDSGFITSASIPTALKNPYAVEIKANGVSLGTYDGSAVATFNLSAANVGAANKVHTHTASDISGLPTKLSAFTNDVGYITGITKSMVEGVLTGDITSHTHSYLPLSGGTLTGSVTMGLNVNLIRNITSTYSRNWARNLIALQVDGVNKFAVSCFGKYTVEASDNGISYGYIGCNSHDGLNLRISASSLSWGDNPILHSGNYNSYAPTLTGTGASGTWGINISGNARGIIGKLWSRENTPNLLTTWNDWEGKAEIGYRSYSYGIYSVAQDITYQFLLGADALTDGLFFRRKNLDGWGNWKVVAFTDSNVASATKLQTSRYIWGQSFDGTGNVNGCLNITSDTIGDYTQGIRINQINDSYPMSSIWLATTSPRGYNNGMWGITATNTGNFRIRGGATSVADLLNITQSGNVGIGTTSPQYKLDVNGISHISGDLIVDGEVSALVA